MRPCERAPSAAWQTMAAEQLWPHVGARATSSLAADLELPIMSHYDSVTSHSAYTTIVRDWMVGSSFHSYVHILRPLLARSCERARQTRNAGRRPSCVYVELGSFCGASLGLALSYPGLTRAVSISVEEAGLLLGYKSGEALRQNVRCLNVHNRTAVKLIDQPSKHAVSALVEALQGEQVDVLLIDADHHKASVLSDVHMYAPFVRAGGAILLDDYRDNKFSPGVGQAARHLQATGVCRATSRTGSGGGGGGKGNFTCLGHLPNVANATTTCAYSPIFWKTIAKALRKDRNAMRAACEQPPSALSNEFVMIKR